jgi:hypothetical protein
MVDTIKIMIHFANDTVGIMQYVMNDNHNIKKFTVTSDDIEKEIAKSSFDLELLPVKSWEIIQDQDIPQDRFCRDAWTWDGSKITHDMAKAKELYRNYLRRIREPLLDSLDIDFIRAQEASDQLAINAVVDRKNELRDITKDPSIEAAASIEDLKKLNLL